MMDYLMIIVLAACWVVLVVAISTAIAFFVAHNVWREEDREEKTDDLIHRIRHEADRGFGRPKGGFQRLFDYMAGLVEGLDEEEI